MTLSRELAIDIETYSSYDLAKVGVYKYCEAPDFAILIIGYKWSDEKDVKTIDLAGGHYDEHDLREFKNALTDDTIIKTAYNANFERTCLAKWLELEGEEAKGHWLDPAQWRDTMILAAQFGLPRSLGAVGKALGLPEDERKDKQGKALIRYFSKPCKPTKANGGRTRNLPEHDPEKWSLYVDYNRQDVVAEQAILETIGRNNRPNQKEEDLWALDQRINDRGVLLDVDLAKTIVEYSNRRKEQMKQEAIELTGLSNPNSPIALKAWLADQGIRRETLTKADIADLLKTDLPDDVRRVLQIRIAVGKSSIKKFQTMIDVACRDNRARGLMQFYGGHTGRWAGRLLQPQNLARNTMPDDDLDTARQLLKERDFDLFEAMFDDPEDVMGQLVRTGFIPSPGHKFVVTDFSAIEARVLAWVAGEDWRLNVFENGGDIYCESASHIYHVPVVKHGVNGELRQRGKVAELALGYGGGVGAMKSMDTTGSVPESEMQQIVTQWRAESPCVTRFWKSLESAAIVTTRGGGAKEVPIKYYDPERAYENETIMGHAHGTHSPFFNRDTSPIKFGRRRIGHTPTLQIRLPSDRKIAYWDPIVDHGRFMYKSLNQVTRQFLPCETYGGKLTENIVQSIARDCLAEKMIALDNDKKKYHIVFHVHDEMVFDVDPAAEKDIDDEMAAPISWAPGLPLKGGTYTCDFYRKD